MNAKRSGVVYSTDQGRTCPECGEAAERCACRAKKGGQGMTAGPVRVERTTRGRKGKTVTVITGLGLDPISLAELGRELKQLCGSGGTVKDGMIEVQGDHADRLVAALLERGHAAKRRGG